MSRYYAQGNAVMERTHVDPEKTRLAFTAMDNGEAAVAAEVCNRAREEGAKDAEKKMRQALGIWGDV